MHQARTTNHRPISWGSAEFSPHTTVTYFAASGAAEARPEPHALHLCSYYCIPVFLSCCVPPLVPSLAAYLPRCTCTYLPHTFSESLCYLHVAHVVSNNRYNVLNTLNTTDLRHFMNIPNLRRQAWFVCSIQQYCRQRQMLTK